MTRTTVDIPNPDWFGKALKKKKKRKKERQDLALDTDLGQNKWQVSKTDGVRITRREVWVHS